MFVTELIRITGDEQWEEWGDDWSDHVEFIGELPGPPSSWDLLARLRQRGLSSIQLDWGANLYRFRKVDLLMVFGREAQTSPKARCAFGRGSPAASNRARNVGPGGSYGYSNQGLSPQNEDCQVTDRALVVHAASRQRTFRN